MFNSFFEIFAFRVCLQSYKKYGTKIFGGGSLKFVGL